MKRIQSDSVKQQGTSAIEQRRQNKDSLSYFGRSSDLLLGLFIVFIFLFTIHFSQLTVFAEKFYIDITSPGLRRLPIAVQNFIGEKEVSDIVKDDLKFTGMFEPIEDEAQIERPEHAFNPNNWRGLGVELVVKGRVAKDSKGMSVIVSAYDVSEGREIFKKEYSASSGLLRTVSHSISNDIYKILTGQKGMFRTKIGFAGERDGKKELYLMDWDGHRIRGLGVTGGILLAPRWSTDGAKLIYSAERNRSWDIYVLDIDSMKEKNIVMLKGLNMAGNFFPNNREFVFTSSNDGKSNIYAGDIAGMKGWKIISSPWIDVSPAVSPDGRSLTFVSNRSGTPQIYVSDRDGFGIKRLTFEGSYNTSPVWSPDGESIAFSGMSGGKNQIFIMKRDGSGLTRLTDKGNNEEPSFSPDGRYIAFSSDRDGTKGIYLMRTNGDGQMRITPKGIKAASPGWGPF